MRMDLDLGLELRPGLGLGPVLGLDLMVRLSPSR